MKRGDLDAISNHPSPELLSGRGLGAALLELSWRRSEVGGGALGVWPYGAPRPRKHGASSQASRSSAGWTQPGVRQALGTLGIWQNQNQVFIWPLGFL